MRDRDGLFNLLSSRYVQYLTWLYLSKDYSDYIIFLKWSSGKLGHWMEVYEDKDVVKLDLQEKRSSATV